MAFKTVKRSLVDLVGEEYIQSVCHAKEALSAGQGKKLFAAASRSKIGRAHV